MRSYKEAIEALNGTKASALFANNSQIYESGGVEGTFTHYLEHHLGPEFKAFKSFTYSDYKSEVMVDGLYAFATETYTYTIILAKDGSTIKRKGVATSTLKKIDGSWRILFIIVLPGTQNKFQ
ncbi:nuclear transport factor 2 family protein [Rufibacter sp. LB8]|uniref:nuclear transport factor 2 family protein n=1 Tax=Rufibacter sp. LB8 TaxID=2777781 RepID=UPI001CEF8C96|nr:nuclear transport factor 2 family protein [Rufibacter sp. LB8]